MTDLCLVPWPRPGRTSSPPRAPALWNFQASAQADGWSDRPRS
ncbi:MAG: hypothetical protein R2695_10165 [Acidimicrobiales bacterium]